jgi:hypothetical protein
MIRPRPRNLFVSMYVRRDDCNIPQHPIPSRQVPVNHIKPTVTLRLEIVPEPEMTSISTASTGSYPSPRDLLQNELQSEVSSGKISSSDQSALSSALDDIDTALKSQGTADSASGSQPPSADDLKSKINDLIAGEVSSGKLTSDQATELQTVFANAFANGSGGAGGSGSAAASPDIGGAHGHHGHHGHGGPPPSDASSTSSSSGSSSSASNGSDLIQQFLQSLQNSLSQASSSSSVYSASGDTSSSSSLPSSLLVDFKS